MIARVAALAVLAVLGAAGTAFASRDVAPFEVIHNTPVPVPGSLTLAHGAAWTPDGRHILFTSERAGSDQTDISLVREDGQGYTCLTCDLKDHPDWNQNLPGPNYNPGPIVLPLPFQDGRRILIMFEAVSSSGAQGPLQRSAWVLECAPSVVDCRSKTLLPVNQDPGDGGPASGVLQRRELRIAPDGKHLAWTIVREDALVMLIADLERVPVPADGTSEASYVTTNGRALNPPGPASPLDTSSERWADGGALYEFKGFADGGRSALVLGFRYEVQPDTWKIDLATGERTRLTAYPDWTEDAGISRDGRTLLAWSVRGMERATSLTLVPRPPFINMSLFVHANLYFIGSAEGFLCSLQPWLLPATGDPPENDMRARAGKPVRLGQPLAPRGPANRGFVPNINVLADLQWSPDSTKVAMFENGERFGLGDPVDTTSRLVVARLEREPTRPLPIVSSSVGDWAPPVPAWHGTSDANRTVTVEGRSSGTATLEFRGFYFLGRHSVRYRNYSDDGRTFLDGTETIDGSDPGAPEDWLGEIQRGQAPGRYDVDLRLSGEHTGFMKSKGLFFQTPPTPSAPVVAEFDGHRVTGPPRYGACPDRLPTVTPLRVRSRRRLTRGSAVVSLRVAADVWGDERPVRGAVITAGGRRVRSDGAGRARVVLRRSRRTARRVIRVTAGDTFGARAIRVPVPRRRRE